MKGETDSERLEHAMSAMSAITGITRVASQIPVDLFPKTSHLIAEQDFGKADAALQSDAKYDSELAWYVADQTLSDFRKKKPTKEELALLKVGSSTIANTSSRVEMYASYIWGTFNETCANKSDVRMS
jgi:hypothetical protein